MADHLFGPDRNPPKPLLIEYYGPLYDEKKWIEFPARYGWEKPSTADQPSPLSVPSAYFSGIECWLYFGMLHHIFGRELNQADFLRDGEDNRKYITTQHLHKYVESSKDWKKKRLGERTVEVVNLVAEQIRNERIASCVRAEMGFLIRILCASLWNITIKRDGPQIENLHIRRCKVAGQWEYRRMLADGWCPLEVEKARMLGNVLSQAYLLQLPRPGTSPETHKLCAKTECVANNINEDEYLTRHSQDDCDCSHIFADMDKLHTILEEGGVPLVAITASAEDGSLMLDVVKKRTGKRYVSISHVWSDGLGNTKGNSLPSCQLQILFEKASLLLNDKEYVPRYEGVYGPLHTGTARLAHFAGNSAMFNKKETVHLWIDTLCIPHRRDVRKLAIQRIREVYLNAYRTMILDSEMRQIVSKDTANFELLQRVQICSGWMRRAWTLQEGLAAKSRLYVLFKDGPINISTIAEETLTKLERGKIPTLQRELVEYIIGTWFTYFQHSITYASKFEKLVDFMVKPVNINGSLDPISPSQIIAWSWFNLAMRAATRAEDRPIILTGILNLDLRKVLDEKGSDNRMRKFYTLLNEFPQDVIFQDGPRFDEVGLRWAMKSCQYTDTIRYLGTNPGDLKPEGLKVTVFPSWIFLSDDVFDLNKSEISLDEWTKSFEDTPQQLTILLTTKLPIMLEPHTEYAIIVNAQMEKNKTRPRVYERQFSEIDSALVKKQGNKPPYAALYESLAPIKSISDYENLPDNGYLVRVLRAELQERSWIIG
ncbi:hypothetical protein N7488_010413 [Penicillium malachiteum]|nr:hypothetical protein N7488_010413 [Penicillium malachiteum]